MAVFVLVMFDGALVLVLAMCYVACSEGLKPLRRWYAFSWLTVLKHSGRGIIQPEFQESIISWAMAIY